MYICLYKGSTMIGKDMKVVKQSKGVKMLLQLLNVDVTFEASG